MGLELKPDKGIKDFKFQPRQPLNLCGSQPCTTKLPQATVGRKTLGDNFWRQIRMQSRQGRHGERERGRQRQRERKAQIERERERLSKTETERDKQRGRADRQSDRETDRQTGRQGEGDRHRQPGMRTGQTGSQRRYPFGPSPWATAETGSRSGISRKLAALSANVLGCLVVADDDDDDDVDEAVEAASLLGL